jgi:hypothetical protein
MVDVVIHFRGVGPQRQQLAAVPAVGNYIFGPGAERRLWQAAAVAIGTKRRVADITGARRLPCRCPPFAPSRGP